MKPRIVVVSTAYAAKTEKACRDSIAEQLGADVRHVYIDAAKQSIPLAATCNLWRAVGSVDPDDVVALVDGDDWLTGKSSLAHIASLYEDPEVWVTYGSYAFADGRRGHAAEYSPDESVRTSPWRATHLKTFRAKLFHHLKPADFQIDGAWLERCVDLATMFPLVELAGWDRTRFVSESLYAYNLAASWEWNTLDPAQRATERAVERNLRSRAPRARLVSL